MALARLPVDNPVSHLLDGEVEPSSDGTSSIKLRIADESHWSDFAVAELAIRRQNDDRWSPLRSRRGDSYPIVLARHLQDGSHVADRPGGQLLFLRLSDLLSRCHAPECWECLQKLQRLWRELGSSLASSSEGKRTLLRSWARPLPLDISSTWVPLRHPIEVAPDLLSGDILNFHVFQGAGTDFEELGSLRHIAGLERVKEAIEALHVSPTFYTAFHNFAWVARNPNGSLLGFEIEKFVDHSANEPVELAAFWKPSDCRLTPRHHAWCISRFIDRFEQASPTGQQLNGVRTERLNQLVHSMPRNCRRMALPAPERLSDRLTLVDALPAFVSLTAKAARYGEAEAHWHSLATRVCRSQAEILEDVGFLLRLAPDLFAFYLLLWELVRRTEEV